MEKWKVNPSFFALLLVASLFVEWKYMIILAILSFIFFKENEKLKKLTIQVVAISSACSLFMLFWNVVESGFSVVDSLANAINAFICVFDDMYTRPDWVSTILNLLDKVEHLLYSLVIVLVYLAKFSFIVAVIRGNEPQKGIFAKIKEYLNEFTNFVDKKLYDLTENNQVNPVNQTVVTPVTPVVNPNPIQQTNTEVTQNNMN